MFMIEFLKQNWFKAGILIAVFIIAYSFYAAPEKVTESENTVVPSGSDVPINATQKGDGLFLVTRVIDGDTIEIEGGLKVRYIGIDTPETVDPRKPVQCFGVEASNKNKELVSGRRVRLENDVSETDKYGRLLKYVYVSDTFINLELVKQGYAYSYPYPPDIKYQDQFIDAQRLAREQNKGLWGGCPNDMTIPAPTAASVPAKTFAPSSGGYTVPTCASTDCDCSDFSTHAYAQWFYDNYDSTNKHRLDGNDKDGLACESLP